MRSHLHKSKPALVQELLRDYTEGAKAKLDDETFLRQLVEDSDKQGLIICYAHSSYLGFELCCGSDCL